MAKTVENIVKMIFNNYRIDYNRLYDRNKTSDRFCVQSRTDACI